MTIVGKHSRSLKAKKKKVPSILTSTPPETVHENNPVVKHNGGVIGRNQLIIGGIAVLIVMVLVLVIGISIGVNQGKESKQGLPETEAQAYDELQRVDDKPTNSTEAGGLPAYRQSERNPDAPTVEVYEDFLCPYCGDLTRALTPTLEKLQAAQQINLEFHIVNLYDTPSTNRYSTRAANAVAYVSEHDPKHVTAFVGALYEKGFQPDAIHYKDISNEQIVAQATKAGVSHDVAEAAVKAPYSSFISKATVYDTKRKELFTTLNGTKGFFPPTILINGKISALNTSDNDGKIVQRFTTNLGLRLADVGNPDVLPTIGADTSAES
ncbi:thioredoxin domain-containing protein [Bifidobacterium sp. ESL0732]|uniref:DsbA family protein n=1 Tax=Bifidobacterium sp. ESL0732 TaxID=2983222 RepID=UPI0023F7DF9A|nr:thioredoxin domain-containing protein [Bifidobacterium sp. ESL0732]WEV63484.1 thioredoxin domain-containing protein [Bifidobacterium sp. ESL0732]